MTTSLCNVCYAEIPAEVSTVDGSSIINKWCETHGEQSAMVERDAQLYQSLINNKNKSIYDGVLIDVTYRCNLRCKWCFQDLSNQDVAIDKIVDEASKYVKNYPVFLSGGEPTIRNDISVIVNTLINDHPVYVLTNGYKINWELPCEWVLSYHEEGHDVFEQAVASAHELQRTFESIIFTASTIEQFQAYVSRCLQLGTIAKSYRIHMASPVGADAGKSHQRIFVSDMLKALDGYDVKISPDAKVNYCPVTVNGVVIMLISWADVSTIDVDDLNCPPWYQGEHLVTRLVKRGQAHY